MVARTFVPPASARWNVAIKADSESIICHHDLAPWNLVRDGAKWVFIDWDGSGPGSLLWDLAYAAQSFVPLMANGDPVSDAKRLGHIVAGYGLSEAEIAAFIPVLATRTRAMYQLLYQSSLTGHQPWARLYQEGHGTYWEQAAIYIEQNAERWSTALRVLPPLYSNQK
ncbi:phosphotransferase [Granulicella sp. 5B5]|uniref:phosphotransferase n=1 Tax=Granulicella sp. 5B5 TaxID=1617967 RepID=UPI0031FC5341